MTEKLKQYVCVHPEFYSVHSQWKTVSGPLNAGLEEERRDDRPAHRRDSRRSRSGIDVTGIISDSDCVPPLLQNGVPNNSDFPLAENQLQTRPSSMKTTSETLVLRLVGSNDPIRSDNTGLQRYRERIELRPGQKQLS